MSQTQKTSGLCLLGTFSLSSVGRWCYIIYARPIVDLASDLKPSFLPVAGCEKQPGLIPRINTPPRDSPSPAGSASQHQPTERAQEAASSRLISHPDRTPSLTPPCAWVAASLIIIIAIICFPLSPCQALVEPFLCILHRASHSPVIGFLKTDIPKLGKLRLRKVRGLGQDQGLKRETCYHLSILVPMVSLVSAS